MIGDAEHGFLTKVLHNSRPMWHKVFVENTLPHTSEKGVLQTECMPGALALQGVAGREVVARFDGGTLTSDGGAVLLREADRATNLLGQFAGCSTDHRDPARVTHPVASLVRQRVCGLALGYEDLNDHDALRHDPLIAVLAESGDLEAPGAGKSTLNRLELTGHDRRGQRAVQEDHGRSRRRGSPVRRRVRPGARHATARDHSGSRCDR